MRRLRYAFANFGGFFVMPIKSVHTNTCESQSTPAPIPTVGIGAGVNCDAQILVWTDLVGLTANPPKLAKAYRNLRQEITGAAEEFARDVRGGTFPGPENTFN